MSNGNFTKGKVFVSLEDTFGSQPRVETDEKLICCVGNGEDFLLTLDEWTANADLIAEAFNVANQSGLTPRKILAQRDELLDAFKVIGAADEADLIGRSDPAIRGLLYAAIRVARAAIARAEGRS